MKTDILIIGSGIAGLSAALTAADAGRDVLIVTKKSMSEGSSRYAQGGIAAVRDFEWDSFAEHEADTLTAGCGVNNRRAVRQLVRNAPAAVAWLEHLGVRFEKEPTREAAHAHSRVWHTGDSTGASIERVLIRNVKKNKYITLLADTTLLDLITFEGVCRGAIIRRGGNIEAIDANATILATGGYGQIFARTTNPTVSVGDGIAAAHRAGAKLKDLEFVQFHPTALVGTSRRLTLLSETLRGEGAVLRNARGERFMTAHHPAAELAPRDVVARAIFFERQTGDVFLDFTRADEKWLRSRFPFIYREVAKAGFDLARDLIPIFPVAHYACGGVAVDTLGRTSVENLFAVGEVSCTGLHGANRLASNSLSEAVVWGRRAGDAAAAQLKLILQPKFKIQNSKFSSYIFDVAEDAHTIATIRKTMWDHVGIVRTAEGLQKARAMINALAPQSFAAKNAVTVARLVTDAAIARKKSVGTHYRIG